MLSAINAFEKELLEQLSNVDANTVVEDNKTEPKDASFVPLLSNSTVVLYFDHLKHVTPDDHVESAAR